jgi:uncharacterized membrane protein
MKVPIVLVVLAFLLSIYFYPQLPDQVASHWKAAGEVDDYMDKPIGVFLIPVLLIGLVLMFRVLPSIDPLHNIPKFQKYYDGLVIAVSLFLVLIHTQLLLWNAGTQIGFEITMPLLIGLLFIYLGMMLEHTKRNWFVGIRTPWTLSSDKVWDKTNKLGSKLFIISGVIALLGFFLTDLFLIVILAPVIISALFLVAYSYYLYTKNSK